jgi:DNA-directed RNA polymerase subunit RPC12/RpoP
MSGSKEFEYTARTLKRAYDTRHEAVAALAQYGDWQNDTVVPISESCLVRQPGTIFVGPDHIGEKYWNERRKYPTTGGVATVKAVSLVKKVNGTKASVEESWWAVDCPVCHSRHEVQGASENARMQAIEAMEKCCGVGWVPPLDWIEDCNVCGDSHRESSECTPLNRREPFPDPESHYYECAECDWDGGGAEIQGPAGACPECGTRSVRAREVATDGGQSVDGTEHRDPSEDPAACSRCGVHIGLASDDYCDPCAREIGAKPPMQRCMGCGKNYPQEWMDDIDISGEDEYYPKIRYLCPDCSGGDDGDE